MDDGGEKPLLEKLGGGADFLESFGSESKTLWGISGPTIFTYICQYSLGALTQTFAGQVGELELGEFGEVRVPASALRILGICRYAFASTAARIDSSRFDFGEDGWERARIGATRTKIPMRKIENKSSLQVAFTKRRGGLFHKATELSILCGAEVAILVQSPAQKLYAFGHPALIDRIDPISRRRCDDGGYKAAMKMEKRR
ncbi:hypothetical protein SASPL_111808 [Salvia splendens]|uniref:MADS-box domain-containing protein n=1 Tax=Salvia splendens TaxID=180675 RepID=A0A8X9A2Q5_SALSN|nr:hypothetical protein SASPL_111808 [Salvia splendens]